VPGEVGGGSLVGPARLAGGGTLVGPPRLAGGGSLADPPRLDEKSEPSPQAVRISEAVIRGRERVSGVAMRANRPAACCWLLVGKIDLCRYEANGLYEMSSTDSDRSKCGPVMGQTINVAGQGSGRSARDSAGKPVAVLGAGIM